jgi:hypothetical protein
MIEMSGFQCLKCGLKISHQELDRLVQEHFNGTIGLEDARLLLRVYIDHLAPYYFMIVKESGLLIHDYDENIRYNGYIA